MKKKHTPGPWDIHSTGLLAHKFEVHPLSDEDGEFPIADIQGDLEQAESNARLIAAAPDMLQALQMLKEAIEGGDPQHIADTLLTYGVHAINKAIE